MADAFLTAAGPAPARGREALLRQVALLGVAASSGPDRPRAAVALAAALHALDAPQHSGALAAAHLDEAWAVWWAVLAAGQAGDTAALAGALADALEGAAAPGPDGREVRRRLADLGDEVTALGVAVPGRSAGAARFAVDGNRVRPERRMLIVGRSSAAFLVDPEWDALRLVRIAPSEGPSGGNRAHHALAEVIDAARRGDAGSGRPVPGDLPAGLAPADLLDGLREDPDVRDRRLIHLANEVREERDHLSGERARLAEERAELQDEKARLRRLVPILRAESAVRRPATPDEAAELLGVASGAASRDVERAYRAAVASCHPDRVDGLHPGIRRRAEDLTVALNAARDLLLGKSRPARAGRG